MKAVSNTTPLRYLIAIEQAHLLGQLFEKVYVPVAVHEELTDARTPEPVEGFSHFIIITETALGWARFLPLWH
jgi:predicted nucleic acid-binding protein